MSEDAEKVKCPECGIEAHVDIRNQITRSFVIAEVELQQKCKHLEQVRENLICPSLQPALANLANSMLPPGNKR